MTVHLNAEIFELEDNFQILNHLFVLFENAKHRIYLNEDISDSKWFKDANKITKVFCEIEFKNSAWIPIENVKIKLENENDLVKDIYSVKDGNILLQNNVMVFIENGTSDRLFLKSIFDNFVECSEIQKAFQNRWIEYVGTGGKNEIIKELNNEFRKFRKENLFNEKYIRAVVILDSDRRFPNDKLSDSHQKLLEYCSEKGIECHVLEKREMENYIPNEAFEDFKHKDDNIVTSYFQLNDLQQYYYDFQDGFKGKNLNKLDYGIQDLYNNLTPANEGILRTGFDGSLPDFSSKKELPKLFNHKNVNRETLMNRCSSQQDKNELFSIIDKINNLL
jgi:hypothetical protein